MARIKSTVKFPRKAKFTIADCIALNDSLNAQTVRGLVRDAINAGTVTVIGKESTGGKGRPSLLLALA